jgi:hypothetical protein
LREKYNRFELKENLEKLNFTKITWNYHLQKKFQHCVPMLFFLKQVLLFLDFYNLHQIR